MYMYIVQSCTLENISGNFHVKMFPFCFGNAFSLKGQYCHDQQGMESEC